MFRQSWLLVLAGCPYIFDEPDLSNVDSDKPTTDESDSDADTDSDTDSDADGDADNAPEVLSFDVSPRMNGILLKFEIDDPQADLNGGTLEVSDGTDQWTIDIPDEIDDYNPGGPSEHLLPLPKEWLFPGLEVDDPNCDLGSNLTWTLTAIDAADHRSDAASHRLVVHGGGIIPEPDYPVQAVGFDPPFVICGEFPQLGDAGRSNDLDLFSFVAPVATTYWFELEWQKIADMDFYIYDDQGYIQIPDTYLYGYDFEFGQLDVNDAGTEWLGQIDYYTAPQNDPPYLGRLLVTPE